MKVLWINNHKHSDYVKIWLVSRSVPLNVTANNTTVNKETERTWKKVFTG
jgi:hypothetical protein